MGAFSLIVVINLLNRFEMCKATMFARQLLTKEFTSGSFHSRVFNETNLMVLSAKNDGFISASFVPEKEHLNIKNTLSGGVIATLADFLTTLSCEVATSENCELGTGVRGVSVDLSSQYYSSAVIGSEVLVESRVKKLGNKLAFLECGFACKETGKQYASVNHVKFLL